MSACESHSRGKGGELKGTGLKSTVISRQRHEATDIFRYHSPLSSWV